MTAHAGDRDLEVSLLERYCSGTASLDETAGIEAWFREYPEQRLWYEQFRAALERGDFPEMSAERRDLARSEFIEAALQRRQGSEDNRTAAIPVGLAARPVTRKKFVSMHQLARRSTLWFPTAALALLGVVAVLGWNVGRHRTARWTASSELMYTTGRGQQANITLPDGNTVLLNVASRLEVPADYVTGDHTVRLVGSGLFTVTHHDGAPFSVTIGAVTTRVLGTSFVMRHYASDKSTIVAVREGKVSVRSLVLSAGQQMELGSAGEHQIRAVDPAQFSFATGTLIIRGVLLRDAINELNRWYDADVRLGDSAVAMRRITGEFASGSPADLTEYLELTFNVRVVRQGRMITLYQI